MTTPAPTVVKSITEAEIRDVTHYCHFIAARQGKRSVVMYRFAEYTPFELLTVLHVTRAVKGDSHRKNLFDVTRDSTKPISKTRRKRLFENPKLVSHRFLDIIH